MEELKYSINNELQKRVEFIGALEILHEIKIDISVLLNEFEKFSKEFHTNIFPNLLEKLEHERDKKNLDAYFRKIDADIYISIKNKNIDLLKEIDERLKKEIRSNN